MANTTQVNLCVEVMRSQTSSARGHSAQWKISAWTTGGNLPAATLKLQATPASGGAPGFTAGCGKDDGTSSCDLGPVDAKSPQRQLLAQLTVPVTASTVTSTRLTVTGSAANLPQAPTASATVAITTPSPQKTSAAPPQTSTTPSGTLAPPASVTVTSPLPVGSLPSIPTASSTLSPGGNAAGLFPTLDPQRAASPTDGARTRPVANTSALPEGAPIVGGQIAGLAALALAFVLAVTRLSIRRRSRGKHGAETGAAAGTPAQPAQQSGTSAAADGSPARDGSPTPAEGTPAKDGE
ncbi:MAG TPA: hypothetical protein VGG83_22705 [Trebonia sp.]